MNTAELAATVVIGTALVLAPIDPQPIRDLNTPLPDPQPEPVAPEPAVVANYDHYGTLWGYDTVTKAEADLAQARAKGHAIEEWNVTDRDGRPLRIVRTTDPTSTFLGGIDIAVIPLPAATTPAPEILETVPANGGLLGYDQYAIAPGAPLPDGRTIATVEDPLGSAWRVTDDQDCVHYLHKHGRLIRYTSGAVTFIEPEWAGWSSD